MNIEFTVINDDGEQVELPRPETKSLDDVRQVCRLHAGNQSMHFVIDLFIELYLKGGQWDWYAEHQAWLERKTFAELNAPAIPIEDQNQDAELPPLFAEPEPVRPQSKTVIQGRQELMIDGISLDEYVFRIQRAAAVKAITVVVEGLQFDGDEQSQRRMLAAIHAAEEAGINTAIWRLADSTEAAVTVSQLRQAHALAIIAQGELWTKGKTAETTREASHA
jgi:hypothetical protein